MLSIKNTVVLAVAASAGAYAQDVSDSASSSASASLTASAATASASANNISTAMIPSDISTSCSTYLHSLNGDAKFASCVQPLTNVTALFNPSQGNNSAAAYATSDITRTLANLCSSSSGCSNSLVRSYLSQFYSACKTELQANDNGNAAVRDMYDFLYVVNPFRNAICTKNGATSRYCVLEIGSSGVTEEAGSTNSTTSASGNGTPIADQVANANATAAANSTASMFKSLAATYGTTAQEMFAPVAAAAANLVIYTPINAVNALSKRIVAARGEGDDVATTTIMTPNTTTFRTTSLSYLFLQPNMSASILCTTCTKNVMASYVAWEAQTPYALGLGASPILGAQQALWESLGETCGTNFTELITAAAGVLTTNSTNAMTTSGARVSHSVAVGGLSVVVGAVVATLGLF